MSTIGWVALIVAVVVVLAALGILFLRMLSKRVVGVAPRRKTVTAAAAAGGTVILPGTDETEASGEYGLWFRHGFAEHARIGDVVTRDNTSVTRTVRATSAPMPIVDFEAQWTGHTASSPSELGLDWSEAAVPLRDGTIAPAWFFPVGSPGERVPWAVHVQGIRTSRLVTLRAVEAAVKAGYASLVITYRGAGDGAPAAASTLGLTEWADLRDAVAYARAQGASSVTVMAWSMGAGLALELARRDPASVDSLVLICPATNWRRIVQHGAREAHLPPVVGTAAIGFLGSRFWSRLAGLGAPIDFDALDWTRPGAVTVPTLVVHSRGDQEIPFELSVDFVAAR